MTNQIYNIIPVGENKSLTNGHPQTSVSFILGSLQCSGQRTYKIRKLIKFVIQKFLL